MAPYDVAARRWHSYDLGPFLHRPGDQLKAARRSLRQTQAECAAALTDLAGRTISQSSVSQLENHKVHRPADAFSAAVASYCQRAEGALSPAGTQRGSDRDAFDSLVRVIADEPLLGPRQEALVRALTDRLAGGPPLSRNDVEAMLALAAVLGLRMGD